MIKYILFSLLLILLIPSFGFSDENEELTKIENQTIEKFTEAVNAVKEKKYELAADIFEKLGGVVIYFGKPYPEIYNFCIKKNEIILAIGDNIRTDIRGANNMKFDSLFIIDGIHKKEFSDLQIEDYDKVLEKYKTKTNYYQERLTW